MFNARLTKISVLSIFKLTSSVGVIVGGTIGSLMVLFSLIIGDTESVGVGVWIILFGILSGILSGAVSAFYAFLFNLFTKIIGGIEINIEKNNEGDNWK